MIDSNQHHINSNNSPDHPRAMRITIIGLIVNAFLAITKLTAGLLGHSYALVADAVESIADIFTSLIVWSGLRVSSLPADENHPYGHGKAEALAGLVVATMLFAAAIGIGVQAVREIIAPQKPPAAFTLFILFGVITVKEGMFHIVRHTARKLGSTVLMADAWHHRGDAITSVAAAIGISIALIGGPDYMSADAWAALLASVVIVYNAYNLLLPPLHELMDAEPTEITNAVRQVAESAPNVKGVEKLFARKSGTVYWVDMHLEVDPDMSVKKAHAISHEVKNLVCQKIPNIQDVLIHIEPHEEHSQATQSTYPSKTTGE